MLIPIGCDDIVLPMTLNQNDISQHRHVSEEQLALELWPKLLGNIMLLPHLVLERSAITDRVDCEIVCRWHEKVLMTS